MFVIALGGLFIFLSTTAFAHIRLDSPRSRTDDRDDIKDGPCGPEAGSTRDETRVTEILAGSTIKVEWTEVINHPSHFRIAFDDDGQDSFVDKTGPTDIVDPPVLPVLLDGILDDNSMPNGTFSAEVTLPDIECDNCTLQLIQYMTDRNEPYYQCADLKLYKEGAGTGGTGGDSGNTGGMSAETGGGPGVAGGGTGGADATATGGVSGIGGAATGGVSAAAGGAVGVGGTAMGVGGAATGSGGMSVDQWMNGETTEEPGGCAIASRSGSSPWSAWALSGMLAGLFFSRRARRTRLRHD
jgi:hypothetical protein